MSNCHFENGADLSADDLVEKVVTEIAARNFHKPSSWNTYIGFRLRCGRLTRELRAYVSIYLKHFDCYPDYIPMDYDWRDEFNGQLIIDVINGGEKIK